MDFFFQMARNKRELGRDLLYRLLVNLLTSVVDDGSKSSSTVQTLSELKDLWLKEVVAGVCQDTIRDVALNGKIERDTLINLSKTEVGNVFGPNFLYDVNLLEATVDRLFTFKKRNSSFLTKELNIFNEEVVCFKTRQFGKSRFPGKCFGFASMNSTVVNQIGIKISNKVTETFSEYFKRLNELPSPNMVAKLSLLWKQKNVKEKLLKYESLKEKHDILCLHTDFVVRKFRVGLTPQSPLDHIFSQVLF